MSTSIHLHDRCSIVATRIMLMRNTLCTAALLVASGLSAQTPHPVWQEAQRQTSPSTGMTAPLRGGGGLQMFSDLAAFQVAASGMSLSFEDFSTRPANNLSPCYEPINSDMGQPGTAFLAPTCFTPGQITEGFSVRTDLGTGPHGFGMMYFGGQITGGGVNVVGAIGPAQATFVDFHDSPVAVAMDVFDWQVGSPLTFIVRGVERDVLGDFTLAPSAPPVPVFVGFISSEPVRRVEIRSASGASQMFGNLYFGGKPGSFEPARRAVRFGAVALGVAAQADLELQHRGDLTTEMPTIQAPAAPFSVVADACSGQVLDVGASCIITYAYTPGVERSDRALIQADGASAEEPRWLLSGHGVAPDLVTGAGVLDFGAVEVGDTAVAAIELRNPAAVAAQILSIGVPSTPFQAQSGSEACPSAPFALAPGQSCQLHFGFAPTAEGGHTDRILVETNTPSSPRRLLLRGIGGDVIFANGFEQP